MVGAHRLRRALTLRRRLGRNRRTARNRAAVARLLLSLCLGLFLADAVVSLADDSLSLWFGIHLLTAVRGMVGLISFSWRSWFTF